VRAAGTRAGSSSSRRGSHGSGSSSRSEEASEGLQVQREAHQALAAAAVRRLMQLLPEEPRDVVASSVLATYLAQLSALAGLPAGG
jgi:hypothetical protein